MILTVGNTKGGVGKTTLAVNIAITRAGEGRKVLLVDGDDQESAANFTELRDSVPVEPDYTAAKLTGSAIRTQGQKMAHDYDDVVIDVGGRDTSSLRAALTISHVLLIPTLPSTFDVWAIQDITAILNEARIINPDIAAYLVINHAAAQGRDNQEAAEALAEIPGIQILPITIGSRKAFKNAAAAGMSVIEHGRDPKAASELRALVDAIYAPVAVEV